MKKTLIISISILLLSFVIFLILWRLRSTQVQFNSDYPVYFQLKDSNETYLTPVQLKLPKGTYTLTLKNPTDQGYLPYTQTFTIEGSNFTLDLHPKLIPSYIPGRQKGSSLPVGLPDVMEGAPIQ